MSTMGLDPERLSSIDEFGAKRTPIPATVKGPYYKRKKYVHALLILFFLALPWFRINGEQAFLLNIAKRQFSFMGLQLYAHDGPLIFFVLATAAFSLLLVTNVWGRLWCGWACPQTVFIEQIFRPIQNFFEGSYIEQRQNLRKPMTAKRFVRKCLKWLTYFLLASLFSHSFVAIFVGTDTLLKMMSGNPSENLSYFLLISFMTGLVLFDFGWFREQFCIIMCPYGRLQSVLMDSTSLAPLYDEKRGEPRRSTGDCIACNRCVEVCPTGIDIRKGLQMECIACTACIDACDEIMLKVKKPTGLIRYSNVRGSNWIFLKPKAIFASVIVLLCVSALVITLRGRGFVDVTVLRGKEQLFQNVGTEGVEPILSNHFRLHIKNQSGSEQHLSFTAAVDGQPLDVVTALNPVVLPRGANQEIHIFVKFPIQILNQGQAHAQLTILSQENQNLKLVRDLHLLGPINSKVTEP